MSAPVQALTQRIADDGVWTSMIALDRIDINAPRSSDAYYLALMGRQFPGSFLPYSQEQITDSARPHFRLVASTSGRRDYIETIHQWRTRFAAASPSETLLKLQLLPRWPTSADFRLAFTSGVSANRVCFERDGWTTIGLCSRKPDERTRRNSSLRLGLRSLRGTLRRAAADAARARELPWPGVDVEMLVPVIAGRVERIVDVLPRGAPGFLKQNAHVPALVRDLPSSAEMLGDGRKQLVCTPPRAHHVDDDRGQRHQADRSRGPPTHTARATGFQRPRPGTSLAAGVVATGGQRPSAQRGRSVL